MGEEEYNKMMDEISFSGFQQTACVKCGDTFAFEPGAIQGNMKDDMGKLLSRFWLFKKKEFSHFQIEIKKYIMHKIDGNVQDVKLNNVKNVKILLITLEKHVKKIKK